jgi:Ca2+-binding RTX toxin-like protein
VRKRCSIILTDINNIKILAKKFKTSKLSIKLRIASLKVLQPNYGDSNDNFIVGMAGDDTIQGSFGNDTPIADDGDDWVDGDHGDRTGWVRDAAGKYIYVGAIDFTGNGFATTSANGVSEYDDIIIGGNGNDVQLYGSTGNNKLYGGTDNDELYGVNGQNLLDGGDGNDSLFGGLGVDDLFGGLGNDSIYANASNDNLSGGDGDDQLFSQEGNDILLGGHGDDIFVGVSTTIDLGRGTIDILTGGGGFDRFILGAVGKIYYDDANTATAGLNDYALITDFSSVDDIIQLSGTATDYILGASVSGISGVGIYRHGTTTDELIGIVQTTDTLSLTDTYFSYV